MLYCCWVVVVLVCWCVGKSLCRFGVVSLCGVVVLLCGVAADVFMCRVVYVLVFCWFVGGLLF